MSGLGLLATAFGSYASTLGGLYKEQVEKEQAAQEKLAAEERQRAWEREKIAGERQFAIDMLQRKFDYDVKLKSMENEWEARNAAIAHERELEKQERLKQIERRDDLARVAMGLGLGAGKGVSDRDPREFAAKARALTEQLNTISRLLANAGEEEKPRLLAMYDATQRALAYLLEYGEVPKSSGNAGSTFFRDPEDIVNSLANE